MLPRWVPFRTCRSPAPSGRHREAPLEQTASLLSDAFYALRMLKDNAAFATYLQAQSWQKILDQVPRPTYPDGSAGWWVTAPPGIAAPAMPGEIADWTFHPGGPQQILAPDPAWKSYASAKHQSIADARQAKPGTADMSESK